MANNMFVEYKHDHYVIFSSNSFKFLSQSGRFMFSTIKNKKDKYVKGSNVLQANNRVANKICYSIPKFVGQSFFATAEFH